jgi:hypothetical protein
MKVVLNSLKTSLLSEHECMNPSVRRPPMLKKLSAETVTVTTGGPERRIKGWTSMDIRPHPLITVPGRIISPLSYSIFTLYRGPGQLPVTARARRPHGGVDLGRGTIVTMIRTVHFVVFPPPSTLARLNRPLHARPCFCTHV